MKFLIVLAALVAAACAVQISDSEVHSQFEAFKKTHGKEYANEAEELYRRKIFKENLIKIAKHNERFQRGEVTYTVGVNKLADLHTHEMVAARNGFRADMKKPSAELHTAPRLWASKKTEVDWRNEGLVSEVKNQGSCGSCWSFSATGALEGQLAKKTGKLVSLSEQNLVDCTRGYKYQNAGCNGGLMDAAFQYVIDNKGIDSEKSYPYKGYDSRCRYNAKNKAGSATGFKDVRATEADLEHAIETVGPVSVAIDASLWSFNMYSSGIYYDEECGNTQRDLDHGVLAVGFGDGYYIVKNSWGADWGENGFVRMARNKNNHCGIALMASYPIV